jgi:hypothetical protein
MVHHHFTERVTGRRAETVDLLLQLKEALDESMDIVGLDGVVAVGASRIAHARILGGQSSVERAISSVDGRSGMRPNRYSVTRSGS